jgi:hypothetical protein
MPQRMAQTVPGVALPVGEEGGRKVFLESDGLAKHSKGSLSHFLGEGTIPINKGEGDE